VGLEQRNKEERIEYCKKNSQKLKALKTAKREKTQKNSSE
jgi:hypothetical protein